jgi:predicted transcriptional regulator
MLRREIWVDSQGRVVRYNLAYINPLIHRGDHGRVLGYDSAHGQHHRPYKGRVAVVSGSSFEQIEVRFQKEWSKVAKEAKHAKTEIRIERVDSFFERGRKLARLADRGGPIPPSRVVAFEDIGDLLHVLTQKRVLLLKQVKATPASISDLAKTLKRDRSAVTRDIQILERFGVVQVSEKSLAGHGRQKWITPVARDIRLTAQF